jgi:hypothetical protein
MTEFNTLLDRGSKRSNELAAVLIFSSLSLFCAIVSGGLAQNSSNLTQTDSHESPATSKAQGVATTIRITPEAVAIAVGEPQILRLRDNKGAVITDAQWSVSDPTIVNAQLGREARLTGLAPGRLTVTATWKGLKAQAQVRIYEFSGLDPSPSAAGASNSAPPGASDIAPPPLAFKMRVTPDIMSVIVGEPRQVRLNNPEGKMIRDATWTVTDPSVIRLDPAAEPILVGLAPGTAFITAVWHGEKAEAKVTVFPGPELPQGTVRWSVRELLGFVTDGITQAQVISADGPDFFVTEHDKFGRWMTRGLTSDGRELWSRELDLKQKPSKPCDPAASKPCGAKTTPATKPRAPR